MCLFEWAEAAGLFAKADSRILAPAVRQRILALLADNNSALLTRFGPIEAPALILSWSPAAGGAEIAPSDRSISRTGPIRGGASLDVSTETRRVPSGIAGGETAIA